jgi:transposase
VTKILDVSKAHVYATKKTYDEKSIKGIKPKHRGRRHGRKRVLSPEQERVVRELITEKMPEQLRIPGCLWTRENIRELIRQVRKVTPGLSTLGYYLARWGFSVQRPKKRAYKQGGEKVAAWVEREFPAIKARAKSEDAEIFFGDETGLQNTPDYLCGYASIGHTPIVRVESKKLRVNMLSAVSNSGKMRFMLYKDNMDADKLIDFMGRLVKDTPKKVFLILDNLRVRCTKKVRAWLDERKRDIEVFYLPPYSPEYNPDEYLNSDVKRGAGKQPSPRSEQELEYNLCVHMFTLLLRPEKVRAFFGTETTRYAAG